MSRPHSDSVSRLNRILPVPIELHNDEEDIESVDNINRVNGSGDSRNNTHQSPKKQKLSHITNVMVGEHHLIEGEYGKPYISWAIKIVLDDSDYSSIIVYKRYSEIEQFHQDLLHHYQNTKSTLIPNLPPKDNFSIERLLLSNNWLEERRKGLQWFMSNVLLNPKLQDCEVIKKFILG
ncbi:Phox homologous domain-containing protein [Scheffersomyces coipomensis]|uniref:Phox homologous domain-containing protein n=1 Tax=Scheffersomyces coipomensis TaxID=1788519 RepID=UPI00315D5EB6